MTESKKKIDAVYEFVIRATDDIDSNTGTTAVWEVDLKHG